MRDIYFHIRGDQRMTQIQLCSDTRLGCLLYELWMDFYTWYGNRDDIIDEKIRIIVHYLNSRPKLRLVHSV
jgi:hypothetical protein